jgi:hypothetical protein
MVDFEKARDLVLTRGTEIQRCRLSYVLGESRDRKPVEKHLRRVQLKEGGFPFREDTSRPFCLSATGGMMEIMADMDLDTSSICRRTIDFVIRTQLEDGRWDENPALAPFDPPFWDRPGDLNTQLWLTGSLADVLTRLGRGPSRAVAKATEFLLRNSRHDGSFKGFRHTTWLAIAVLAPIRGVDDEVVSRTLAALDRFEEWDATDTAWALECMYWGGIPAEHDVVRRFLDRLESLQYPDGHWEAADEPTNLTRETVVALIVLKRYSRP